MVVTFHTCKIIDFQQDLEQMAVILQERFGGMKQVCFVCTNNHDLKIANMSLIILLVMKVHNFDVHFNMSLDMVANMCGKR